MEMQTMRFLMKHALSFHGLSDVYESLNNN